MIKNIKSASLEHGRAYESIAIDQYKKDTGNEIKSSGLVVSKTYPFLAASPDGFVDKDHLIEVKCPYVSRDKTISTLTVPYLKQHDDGSYYIESKHDYYYQIQGQLLCSGAKACTLIVCLANNLKINAIKYIEIERDETFILDMIKQLEQFFNDYYKQEILEKHFYNQYISQQ